MAEGGGLLNRYTLLRRIEGSNPSVSASSGKFTLLLKLLAFASWVQSSFLLRRTAHINAGTDCG